MKPAARNEPTKAADVQARLREFADPQRADVMKRFMKTGPGEYGEGDQFIGVALPPLRKVVREFQQLDVGEVVDLLNSPIHEDRMAGLLIWTRQFPRADEHTRKAIYEAYLTHTHRINSWDLVDASAPHVVGAYLETRNRAPLRRLAKSRVLWDRRIAVLATQHFIRRGDFGDTLAIAETLLGDAEDLIHKGVGWMLREVGQRDRAVLESFLKTHYPRMPRTMLRYAIEKLPETRRQAYLKGRVRD